MAETPYNILCFDSALLYFCFIAFENAVKCVNTTAISGNLLQSVMDLFYQHTPTMF